MRCEGDFNYAILKNDEKELEDWYGCNILHLIRLITTSPNYHIDDEYVLEDGFTNSLISGDEKSILEKLEKNMEKYISTLISYLNNGTIFYSYWMRPIIEEYY